MTSDIRLSSSANRRAEIYPTQQISPVAAPFVTMVQKLFGSQGPLSSYSLTSIELNGSEFTIGVRGAWRPAVAKAISDVIQRHADGDINTQGWKFVVTDTTNEELPRG